MAAVKHHSYLAGETPIIMSSSLLEATARALGECVPALSVSPGPTGDVDEDSLRTRVAGLFAELLERSPQGLMSVLYRIDVDERIVRRILTECPPNEIPFALADAAMDRQMKKIRTRQGPGDRDISE